MQDGGTSELKAVPVLHSFVHIHTCAYTHKRTYTDTHKRSQTHTHTHRHTRTHKHKHNTKHAPLQVWADVYTMPVPGCDGKTAAEIFEAAGAVSPAAPSCAACLGGPRDTFARMNEPEVGCAWVVKRRQGLMR